MICYKDRTFCPFHQDCKHAKSMDCDRPLTEGIRTAAKQCGLPISQFVEKPKCHEEIKK